MQTYHQYHPSTFEFIGSDEAMESPLEPGQYLIPANATTVAPGEVPQGSAALWNEQSQTWKLVPDYRGDTYWDTATGEKHVIDELEQTPLPEWTNIERNDEEAVWTGSGWELPLEVAKSRKVTLIRQSADKAVVGLQSNWSAAEIASWDKQAKGAGDLNSDPDSDTVEALFVNTIAESRGIEVGALVEKILANLDDYNRKLSSIIGAQQRLEDAVEAAANKEEVDAVSSELTMNN